MSYSISRKKQKIELGKKQMELLECEKMLMEYKIENERKLSDWKDEEFKIAKNTNNTQEKIYTQLCNMTHATEKNSKSKVIKDFKMVKCERGRNEYSIISNF
jgi:hypothetical protein